MKKHILAAGLAVSLISPLLTFVGIAAAQQLPFYLNDRVHVVVTKTNVYSIRNAHLTKIGTQPRNALGTILSTSTSIIAGHEYWSVNFDSGVDGWTDRNNIDLAPVR